MLSLTYATRASVLTDIKKTQKVEEDHITAMMIIVSIFSNGWHLKTSDLVFIIRYDNNKAYTK